MSKKLEIAELLFGAEEELALVGNKRNDCNCNKAPQDVTLILLFSLSKARQVV